MFSTKGLSEVLRRYFKATKQTKNDLVLDESYHSSIRWEVYIIFVTEFSYSLDSIIRIKQLGHVYVCACMCKGRGEYGGWGNERVG